MLLNVSYNDPVQKKTLLEEVGPVINLKDRWRIGGTGSPKLFITQSSVAINNLLMLDNNLNTCNIEIRSKGIIIRFRSILETYALVIPFYKLAVYKGNSQEYTFHKDHHFIRIAAKTKGIHNFIKKISDRKIEHLSNQNDQL
ncbi:hypothetical protein HX109_02660 [Galbibacter sp. BG1]|uniref:hypothetical protein n=1 Tax=Galbibacter sp. BG1 TaxID=1170699 RepID=UPI0015BE6325|nr:hypothetical protein [Galbibacter sp. BG1]QLE00514.1 hypothetical protein HX109_02660 [Galbibacter sp. BG1]